MADTKIIVCGAAGRMGRAIIEQIAEAKEASLCGAIDRVDAPGFGEDAGLLAGVGSLGVRVTDKLSAVLSNAHVAIDFTAPSATIENANACGAAGVAFVTGTTGLSAGDQEVLQAVSKKVSVVQAPNMHA